MHLVHGQPTEPEANEAVIRRFYEELWNRWQLGIADEIVSDTLRFRGSLGNVCEGREAFKRYVETVHVAFPDWQNRVDEIFAVEDRVITRMNWTGTHQGALGAFCQRVLVSSTQALPSSDLQRARSMRRGWLAIRKNSGGRSGLCPQAFSSSGLPDRHRPRAIVIANRSILGHELMVMLDGRCVDQSIGRIARERGGKIDGRIRDCGRHAYRSQL
jgi:hypothetical protein